MHTPLDCSSGIDARESARDGNSYDFVRFLAACAVLFSHHFALAGLAEPRVPGYGGDFGELGVEIFFVLSGFLICRSLRKGRGPAHYVAARSLRIFPNLAVALAVTSGVTLLWYGNAVHWRAHVGYVLRNLAMMFDGVTFVIPGVFPDALQPVVNEPLWTLPYELWMYVLLGVLFFVGRNGFPVLVLAAALVASLAWTFEGSIGDRTIGPLEAFELGRLGSFFLSGAALALVWHRLGVRPLRLGLAGLAGALLVRNLMPADSILTSLSLAACVLGLGASRAFSRFARGGDPSYGMYIFAWPVQQFSLLLVGAFWPSMIVAIVVTTAIGYATWHAFEARVLRYAERLARPARTEHVDAGH